MSELSASQIESSNKLLEKLCKSNQMDGDTACSEFTDKDDAKYCCKILESLDYVKVMRINAGDIGAVFKNDNTCNAFKNNILKNKFNYESSTKNSLDNPIEKHTIATAISTPEKKSIFKKAITSPWVVGVACVILAAILNADKVSKWINNIVNNMF